METKDITISNDGKGIEEALELASQTAVKLGLDSRQSIHMRLLAEELMGMVKTITHEFEASFKIITQNSEVNLILDAKADMDYYKKQEFISVSSTGKNESSRGIMGKIKNMFEHAMHPYGGAETEAMVKNASIVAFENSGMHDMGAFAMSSYVWSLQSYRGSVEETDEEAWDELEKSIIANLADDVKVGVDKDDVKLIIVKKF